ncbi:hypothetical protein O0L34_g14926 [Tuta absoluta]|nr:hypothetical protein O0L34_g14926 [Tuta absoluta]
MWRSARRPRGRRAHRPPPVSDKPSERPPGACEYCTHAPHVARGEEVRCGHQRAAPEEGGRTDRRQSRTSQARDHRGHVSIAHTRHMLLGERKLDVAISAPPPRKEGAQTAASLGQAKRETTGGM